MTKKKDVAVPKETAKAPSKPNVKLLSYTIKAVIPTGAYANIQPEITVQAENLQEAENYVIPHINKLFEDFLNKSERRTVQPKVEVKEVVIEPTKVTVDGNPTGMTVEVTEAFKKANNAIVNAMSHEALDIISDQIQKSVKLQPSEKDRLMVELLTKIKEFE